MKNTIHAKALGIGAAALLASGIAGAPARAQAVAQPNPTAARLNAVANLIQGQPAQPVYQQPAYAPNGYVQQPYATPYQQPIANGYVPTQYTQPTQAYATPYQQPTYSGYSYTQPQQAYTPYQQAYPQQMQTYPQTKAGRYANAVRSIVQPRRYQYAAPGYATQAAPMYVTPR